METGRRCEQRRSLRGWLMLGGQPLATPPPPPVAPPAAFRRNIHGNQQALTVGGHKCKPEEGRVSREDARTGRGGPAIFSRGGWQLGTAKPHTWGLLRSGAFRRAWLMPPPPVVLATAPPPPGVLTLRLSLQSSALCSWLPHHTGEGTGAGKWKCVCVSVCARAHQGIGRPADPSQVGNECAPPAPQPPSLAAGRGGRASVDTGS